MFKMQFCPSASHNVSFFLKPTQQPLECDAATMRKWLLMVAIPGLSFKSGSDR